MGPDQELLDLAGAASESKTLFDEPAGLASTSFGSSSEARCRVGHGTARSELKTDSPSNSLDVSHIGTKDFRNGHGSIGVLVLFDDRDQHSGARNRRVVQRITKT